MGPKDFDKAIITISKEEISMLPAADYAGKIEIIDKPEQVASAVEKLLTADVIGFDTETRPSFRKGQYHNVALIQLAIDDVAYLFRTNIIGLPKQLIEILENPDLLKVGLSLRDDFHNLNKISEIRPEGFIDLQSYVKNFKIADASLSRIHAILFGERLSKGQRLTNWEATELSEAQQSYAALDAKACINIYKFLKSGMFDPADSPYLTIPPEPEINETDINSEISESENQQCEN